MSTVPSGAPISARRTGSAAVAAGAVGPRRRPDPSSPARPQHLRVVAPQHRSQDDRRRRRRVRVASAVGLAVAVAFGLVYLHIVLAQRQFALDHLTAKVTAQQEQYQQLRLQVAQVEAPARIISVAEGKLGMREPSSVTYLTPSGSAVPAVSAAAAAGGKRNVLAPAGDADWPQIKSLLAGSP